MIILFIKFKINVGRPVHLLLCLPHPRPRFLAHDGRRLHLLRRCPLHHLPDCHPLQAHQVENFKVVVFTLTCSSLDTWVRRRQSSWGFPLSWLSWSGTESALQSGESGLPVWWWLWWRFIYNRSCVSVCNEKAPLFVFKGFGQFLSNKKKFKQKISNKKN